MSRPIAAAHPASAPLLVALSLAAALGITAPAAGADAPAGAAAAAVKDPIAWETSYASTLEKAESESRPIVLKFYTGWCAFCTKMDKTTWQDAKVAEAAKGFACGKVNADVDAPAVARYRTTGYPTVILATPGGDPVVRLEGYKDAATMARVLTKFSARKDALSAAAEGLKKDRKDVAAQFTLTDFLAEAGLHEQAADSYLRIAKGTEGGDLVRANAAAGLHLTRAGKAEQAAKILAKALEGAGAQPSASLMLALGENAKALGKETEARTWLERLVADQPGSPEAAAARSALGG